MMRIGCLMMIKNAPLTRVSFQIYLEPQQVIKDVYLGNYFVI